MKTKNTKLYSYKYEKTIKSAIAFINLDQSSFDIVLLQAEQPMMLGIYLTIDDRFATLFLGVRFANKWSLDVIEHLESDDYWTYLQPH